MSVRIGSSWSKPREVHGGVPQGSILGVFLFNVTTDDLEDGAVVDDLGGIPGPETGSLPTVLPLEDPPVGDGPITSSPTRGAQAALSPDVSPVRTWRGLDVNSFAILPGVRNVPPDLTAAMVAPPPEPNPRTSAKWKPRKTKALKYVDDGLSIDRINYENSTHLPPNVRLKHAVNTQNLFRHVVGRAEAKGNTDKTQLLVISDSPCHADQAYIEDIEGNELTSGPTMKVLGFYFSSEPTVAHHVEALCCRFRQKYWILIHLRRFGFTEEELAKVYKTIVRPVADYCSVLYHPMMTDQLDEKLDRCQMHALRCIYGQGHSYSEMRSRAGVPTLRQWRIEQCDKFAASALKNERFSHWFPKKTARSSSRAGKEVYLEKFARCSRLRNSPLYYMRRRLNGKEGKIYGEKNKDRREDGYVGGRRSDTWKQKTS